MLIIKIILIPILLLFSQLCEILSIREIEALHSGFIVVVESLEISKVEIPFKISNFKSAYVTASLQKFTIKELQNLLHFWGRDEASLDIFIFPKDETDLHACITQIVHFHSGPRIWKDSFVLIYPEFISNSSISKISKKISQATKVPIDANIFVAFPTYLTSSDNCSDSDSSLFIWEFYNNEDAQFYQEFCFSGDQFILTGWNHGMHQKVAGRKAHGQKITATAGFELDYIHETKFSLDNSSFQSGMAVSMFHDIQISLNFSYSAIPGRWIVDNLTNSIDQLVSSGNADIAISQTTLTLDTVNFTDLHMTYLQPTSSFKYFAILTQPPARTIRNAITVPFTTAMWSAYACVIFFIFITILISTRISVHFKRKYYAKHDTWTISDVFLTVMATVCQQEFNIIKKKGPSLSFSLKLIVWTSYLTGTTIYIGYSATVVSFMATRNLVPIRTAEELKSSSLPIYGDGDNIGNPYVYEGVVDTTDPRNILSPEEALQKLQTEVGAYLGFSDAYTAAGLRMGLTEDFLCKKFSHIPFSKIDYKSSMFVKKGSPYREFFNYRIMAGKECGLNHRYVKIYLKNTALNCAQMDKPVHKSLTVFDVFLPFLINLNGMCISLLVLLGEQIINNCKSQV